MKLVPTADGTASTCSGLLVFQLHEEPLPLCVDTPILEVFVAGETACNIFNQLHGFKPTRPVVHDLLHQVLFRASEQQGHTLLRVAIVDLKDDIFIGRLFFGDAKTGVVAWDCDCRPSDGVFLSLRTGCPFYVERGLWERTAVPIRLSKAHVIAQHEAEMAALQQEQAESLTYQQQCQPSQHSAQQEHGGQQQGGGGMAEVDGDESCEAGRGRTSSSGSAGASYDVPNPSGSAANPSSSGSFAFTAIRSDDPESIKLLKRELEVAVREEDYAAAVHLRDHPHMQLYRRIEAFADMGRAEEANSLRRQLASLIGDR